jgi:hypothetical protein
MANRWFITRDGKKRYGPFSDSQLRQLVPSGRLLPSDMLWLEGAPTWVPASSVNGLFSEERETTVRFFDRPSPASLENIAGQALTSLLISGIVNPLGPTLNAVVAAGELRAGVTVPVVYLMLLMLNPFTQECHAVGELTVKRSWRPDGIVRTLFGLPFGSCPTMLLPSVHLTNDLAVSLHTEFLRRFADARSILQSVRRYPGNPWDRVSREMNVAFEGAMRSATGACGQAYAEPLNEDEARELASVLLSEQHTKPELQAFLYAWDGSIKFQREQGLPGQADTAMSLEAFRGIFTRIALTCRVPEVGQISPPNPVTELREMAEVAFHQGYKVRDKATTEEALTVLVTQLFELFGASPQFNSFFRVLDTVKRAVEVQDWESGTAPLLAVLAKLRQVEAAVADEQD